MGYNLLKNGIYWGYNPFINHLLTSWDIQVVGLPFLPQSWKGKMGPSNSIYLSNTAIFHFHEYGRKGTNWGFPNT